MPVRSEPTIPDGHGESVTTFTTRRRITSMSCRTAFGANGADSSVARSASGGCGSASMSPAGASGPARVDE
eukprot:scaffold26008_cov23-Tisochrysis_lutea.AAC.2